MGADLTVDHYLISYKTKSMNHWNTIKWLDMSSMADFMLRREAIIRMHGRGGNSGIILKVRHLSRNNCGALLYAQQVLEINSRRKLVISPTS